MQKGNSERVHLPLRHLLPLLLHADEVPLEPRAHGTCTRAPRHTAALLASSSVIVEWSKDLED